MTTFNPGIGSGMPTDCTELSKAIVWAWCEAERLQPKAMMTLTLGEPAQFMITKSTGKTPESGTRFTGAAYFFMKDDWGSIAIGKMWEKMRTGSFLTENSPAGAVEDFNPGTGGSIPSTVNTIPKLIYYLTECYLTCNSNESIIETEYSEARGTGGTPLPVATQQQFSTFYYGPLTFCRVSVPIMPSYGHLDQALYKSALKASDVILPSSLTTA